MHCPNYMIQDPNDDSKCYEPECSNLEKLTREGCEVPRYCDIRNETPFVQPRRGQGAALRAAPFAPSLLVFMMRSEMRGRGFDENPSD